MRAFLRQRRLPCAIAIEARAPVDELAHVADAVLDQHAHRRLVAQAVARRHRVLEVLLRRVVLADRSGNAALCISGIALGRIGLREDGDGAVLGEIDRGAQPGDTAADDEEVARSGREPPPRVVLVRRVEARA